MTTSERWPHIAALLELPGGHIMIGSVAPIERAAVAVTEQQLMATLVRREGEDVAQLLQRLDEAVGTALQRGEVTNEVNGGRFRLAPAQVRKRR